MVNSLKSKPEATDASTQLLTLFLPSVDVSENHMEPWPFPDENTLAQERWAHTTTGPALLKFNNLGNLLLTKTHQP